MNKLRDEMWEILFNDGSPIGVAYNLAFQFKKSALFFTGAIVLIYIGYKVMLYMADINSKLDPFVLIRPILTLAALTLYTDLVDLLIFEPVDLINDIVKDAVANRYSSVFSDIEGNFLNVMTLVPLNYDNGGPTVYEIIALFADLEFLHLLIIFVASAVGTYILTKQVIIAAVYYMLGPFVFPFSLVVGNQSVFGNWFFGFVSIMLWLPVFNILMAVIALLGPGLNSHSFGNALYAIGMQVAFIGLILQVPKYANVLVSKGSDLSKGGGVVAGAVGAAYGASKFYAQQRLKKGSQG